MDDGGVGEGDEVVDVTDLTDAQQQASTEIQQIDDKFVQLSNIADKLLKSLEAVASKATENEKEVEDLKQELIKRTPTPVEKLRVRAAVSYPYNEPIDDYWKNKSKQNPNYQIELDNNSDVDNNEEEYVLTQDDVKNTYDGDINMYKSFNKSLGDLIGI
jgi:hypothetical protein